MRKYINKIRGELDPEYAFGQYWQKQHQPKIIDQNIILSQNSFLMGQNSGIIILDENIDVLITGTFEGIVIGKGENKIIVAGKVNAILAAKHIELKPPTSIKGTIIMEHISVVAGIILMAKMVHDKLINIITADQLEDFDYLGGSEFEQAISRCQF